MLKFDISSSDGTGTYTVTIEGQPGSVKMFCTCAAGEKGTSCKHRVNLLDGDYSAIQSNNADELKVLSSWMAGSNLDRSLTVLESAEKELEKAKRQVSAAKKQVGLAMRNG